MLNIHWTRRENVNCLLCHMPFSQVYCYKYLQDRPLKKPFKINYYTLKGHWTRNESQRQLLFSSHAFFHISILLWLPAGAITWNAVQAELLYILNGHWTGRRGRQIFSRTLTSIRTFPFRSPFSQHPSNYPTTAHPRQASRSRHLPPPPTTKPNKAAITIPPSPPELSSPLPPPPSCHRYALHLTY